MPAGTKLPGTNGWATAALLAGICGGLGLGSALGLTFRIIALRQIKQRPQHGRGLAVAAVVISSLTAVVFVAAGISVIIDKVNDRAAGIDRVEPATLMPGDCVRDLDEATTVYDMPVVPWSAAHKGDVYHVFPLPGRAVPRRGRHREGGPREVRGGVRAVRHRAERRPGIQLHVPAER